MYKRIICIGLCCILLFAGCGTEPENPNDNIPTPTPTTTTTTTTLPSVIGTTITSAVTSVTATSFSSTDTAADTAISHPVTTTSVRTSTASTTAGTTTVGSTSTVAKTTKPATFFTATIRDEKTKPVRGVTVSVWASDDICIGYAATDNNGVVRIMLADSAYHSFRVKLSNLPEGYEANAEYRFSTTTVNITIRKSAIQNELDHSGAQYDVGMMMTDFSLTDTDGKSYRLSSLLKEKKLVILDFWFVNCQPCRSEFPYFEELTKKYGDSVTLLAVNPIDSVNSIQSLRNQLNNNPNTAISFPMLKDTCNLYLGFDVMAYPTTVFVDANGQILDIHIGAYPSAEALFAEIEKYIG